MSSWHALGQLHLYLPVFFFSVTRQGCVFPGAAVVNKIINYLQELRGFSFKDSGTLEGLTRTKELDSEGHPRK
jgi:hypothetical protein